jgi:hypothetical protein
MDSPILNHLLAAFSQDLLLLDFVSVVLNVAKLNTIELIERANQAKVNKGDLVVMKHATQTLNVEVNDQVFALFSTPNVLDNCTVTAFDIKLNGKVIVVEGSETFYQSFKFDVANRSEFLGLNPQKAAVLGRKLPVTDQLDGNFFKDHWDPKMRFVAMLVALHFKFSAWPEHKQVLIDLLKANIIPCEVQVSLINDWTVTEKNFLSGCLVVIGLLFMRNPDFSVHDLVPEEYKKHFDLESYELVGKCIVCVKVVAPQKQVAPKAQKAQKQLSPEQLKAVEEKKKAGEKIKADRLAAKNVGIK